MKYIIFGDSIQNQKKAKKYGSYIQTALVKMGIPKKNIQNQAKSCAPIADVTVKFRGRKVRNIYQQVKNTQNLGSYNWYLIAGGTNDYGYKGGCATPKQTVNSLNRIFKMIKAANPKARIIVVTPLQRFKKPTGKKSCNCERTANKKGYSLADYRKAITNTASKYDNTVVVDGLKLTKDKDLLDKSNTKDFLHPRAKFARIVIVPKFVRAVRNYIK